MEAAAAGLSYGPAPKRISTLFDKIYNSKITSRRTDYNNTVGGGI